MDQRRDGRCRARPGTRTARCTTCTITASRGAYSDYDVVYANNKPVSASYSNGMTQTWSYNADGSLHELVVTGITGAALHCERHALCQRQAGERGLDQRRDGLQTETWNADGTVHDIHYYGSDRSLHDYDVVYANNKPVSATTPTA